MARFTLPVTKHYNIDKTGWYSLSRLLLLKYKLLVCTLLSSGYVWHSSAPLIEHSSLFPVVHLPLCQTGNYRFLDHV